MHPDLIFVPLLMQIVLTLILLIRLGQAREQAVRRGEVDQERRGLHDDAWPDSVRKINNSIRNQFETPVLFYVLVICLWLLNAAGTAALVIAFCYAGLRIAHAWIHTTTNVVRIRKRLFQGSVVMLLLLTAMLLLALLSRVI